MKIPEELYSFPKKIYLDSFSALDRYFRRDASGYYRVITEGSLVDLAKHFETVQFPGVDYCDGIAETEEGTIRFLCRDGAVEQRREAFFSVLSLLYDIGRNTFIDNRNVYSHLRGEELHILDSPGSPDWRHIADAAVLTSRYGYTKVPDVGAPGLTVPLLSGLEQKELLTLILASDKPWLGLEYLSESGFIKRHWPELEGLEEIQQGKSHHPEGNVWQHTLETFKYRKTNNLLLSLSLLLHDTGKKDANKQGQSRFHLHSHGSALLAEKFLRRLGFSGKVVGDVSFLVKNHMLPGALPKLPSFRVEKTLESPLFPLLLEVYRCDLHSTFRGPDGYYSACKVYRAFLKHRKNPFRDAAGKKMLRLYVE